MSVQEKTIKIKEDECSAFQYILCVGSSVLDLYSKGKPVEFQYILCVGSRITIPTYHPSA